MAFGYFEAQGQYHVDLSRCSVCGGQHNEVICPRSYAAGGAVVLGVDDRILGAHMVTQYGSQVFGRLDDVLMVTQPEANVQLMSAVGDSPWRSWRDDGGIAHLEHNVLRADQCFGLDPAAVSLNAGVLRSDMAVLQLSEPDYTLIANPKMAVIGDTLMQPCKSCGAVHITAGACLLEFTSSLQGISHNNALVGMMPDSGFVLDQRAWGVALPIDDQAVFSVNRAGIHGYCLGQHDSVMLTSQRRDIAVFGQLGTAFVDDVNVPACPDCGSFHAGISCPSSLTLASYLVNPGSTLRDLIAPDRFSLSETLVPFWRGSSTPSPYFDLEFGDYLAARVGDAVHEAIRSHGTVKGDLIVQVAVLVQAQTGDISQIGISYN